MYPDWSRILLPPLFTSRGSDGSESRWRHPRAPGDLGKGDGGVLDLAELATLMALRALTRALGSLNLAPSAAAAPSLSLLPAAQVSHLTRE